MQNYSRHFSKHAYPALQAFISRLRPRNLHLGEHFVRGSSKEIELTSPVPLAGRNYLPNSHVPGFPKFLSGPRENFPLVVKAENAAGGATLKHWAKRSREVIEEAYKKYENDGTAVAILFRGLPVSNEKDFAEWSNNLGYESFRYYGGTAARGDIAKNVSEGSVVNKTYTIEPHSEMAYSVNYPKIFTMSSIKTASWGGETAICDVRDVVAKLDPSFVEKCEKKQVRYWTYATDENDEQFKKIYLRSWQGQFYTDDRTEVEEHLEKNGYSYEWDGSNLAYWHNLAPFISHARSGERLWFTHITTSNFSSLACLPQYKGMKLPVKKYPIHTFYGDGEEFEQHALDEHTRVTWESAVGFQWQDGDVLFLDQLVVQHSRLSFEGERKVAISLLNY